MFDDYFDSTAEIKESFASDEESKTPAGVAVNSYAKENTDNQAYEQEKVPYYDDIYYYDDDSFVANAVATAPAESFIKDQESVEDTEEAAANDASTNDNNRDLQVHFPSIQDFQEYVTTTCEPVGAACSAHHHCCSTMCIYTPQHASYSVCAGLLFEDDYYASLFDDDYFASRAEIKESFASDEESKTPAGVAVNSYAKENTDNQAYFYYDDDYAAAESFIKDQESVQDTEEASTTQICLTRYNYCHISDPSLCCSGSVRRFCYYKCIIIVRKRIW